MATLRQKKAIDNVVENGGNVTKAMRDAGYAETTVNNPDNLTKSDAWLELMEAYLPDDMLLGALSDDIEKKEGNRKAELELAFKLRGKMVEKTEGKIEGKIDLLVQTLTEEDKKHLSSLLIHDLGSTQ